MFKLKFATLVRKPIEAIAIFYGFSSEFNRTAEV
jgi:hypothetical protein